MCGFLISISEKKLNTHLWKNAFNSIKHRGPDNSKVILYSYKKLKLTFGFHRLSIVDHKNNAANQPYVTKKSILVFNGEIYNYRLLKKKLLERKIKFRTKSDTEVLIRYLEFFGLKKTLNDLEGMWSFVWFLKKDKKIYLARDRYGEKPLYYFKDNNQFIISSEIKSILLLTQKKFILDKSTTNNFLKFGLINYDKKTLFSKIYQNPPSFYTELNLNLKFALKLKKYHNFKIENNSFSFKKNSLLLKKKLTESLISRLSKEVKVGFLISGGIDSSINFSIAKNIIKNRKLNLFFSPSLDKKNNDNKNIHFLEKYYNLNVNKTYLPQKKDIIFKYLKKLTWINDYPIGTIASINQYLMGKQAKKKNIKILISGQGADELFYGYLKYYSFYVINLFKAKKILIFLTNITYLIKANFFKKLRINHIFKYLNLSYFEGNKFINENFTKIPKNYKNFSNLKKRSFEDMNQFSIPTICHTEDRMYMASGIETRFPYLNKDLQFFSLSLPDIFKLSFGYTKFILRKAFQNKLHNKILFAKNKVGFETGLDIFLKKNFFNIKKNILNHDSIVFKEKIISKKFLKYLDNYSKSTFFKKYYDSDFIFKIICFEIWIRVFKKYLILKN